MDTKQIVKSFISKDCGIISAICFVLTCIGLVLTHLMQPTLFRLSLFVLLYILLIVTIFCTRTKYLEFLIKKEKSQDYAQGFKLLLFSLGIFITLFMVVVVEFLTFSLFRGDRYIFNISAILTTIFFIVIYFSYIGISEFEYLKDKLPFKEFLKIEKFNKKYSINTLAKFTSITLIQFISCLLLITGLIKYCTTLWIWLISTLGCYIANLVILRLEDLKIYYLEHTKKEPC